jgi:TatA/E family protein of Tat protein translocase
MLTFAFLGMPQVIFILMLVLLVFGPEKVPEMARQIGRAMREMKKMSGDVQRALDLDEHLSFDTYSSPGSYTDYNSAHAYQPPSYEYESHTEIGSHTPLDQHGLIEESVEHSAELALESGATTEATLSEHAVHVEPVAEVAPLAQTNTDTTNVTNVIQE